MILRKTKHTYNSGSEEKQNTHTTQAHTLEDQSKTPETFLYLMTVCQSRSQQKLTKSKIEMLYIFGQLLSTTHMEKRGGRKRGRAGRTGERGRGGEVEGG